MSMILPITVAISTRDRPDMLARCLETLAAAPALPAEIVVVDQSRDQETCAIVERCRRGAATVVYVRHAGSGLGISQNIAFRTATQPVVAVTDDDCVPAPGWLPAIERAFNEPSSVDALTGRVLPLGPEAPGRYPVSLRTSTVRVDFGSATMPWDIGSGNNFAVRRAWLARIGGNDERLGPGAAGQGGVDMDLFYRLLRAGARMRYEPDALVYHERTGRAGRRGRRGPYGYGMGAACVLWARSGDPSAPRVLARWFVLRGWRLLGALRRREWELADEERLVLGGTVRGIIHGLLATAGAQAPAGASR